MKIFASNHKLCGTKITNFLSVNDGELLLPLTRKLNSDHVIDIVNNYDELVKSLDGSIYQNMIS